MASPPPPPAPPAHATRAVPRGTADQPGESGSTPTTESPGSTAMATRSSARTTTDGGGSCRAAGAPARPGIRQNGAMDLHLNGKVVLITGGTDGLGAALANRLVEEGARSRSAGEPRPAGRHRAAAG